VTPLTGVTKITGALYRMRELVLSWDLNDAVEFAKTEEGLRALARLLGDRNPRVRLRSLSVLSRILRDSNSGKARLLELFFGPLVELLESNDERVFVRTLPVLRLLLKGSHISLAQFERLMHPLFSIAARCNGMAWNEAVELLKGISVAVMPHEVGSLARRHLNSNNPRVLAMSAYVIAKEGDPLDSVSEEYLRALKMALKEGDPTTVELAMATVRELLKVPPVYPVDTVLLGIVQCLRTLSKRGSDVAIRHEARVLLGIVVSTLKEHYRKNPWELEKALTHITRSGRKDDAVLMASLLGDPSVLVAVDEAPLFADSVVDIESLGSRGV